MTPWERRQQQQRVLAVCDIVLRCERRVVDEFKARNPQYEYVALCATCNEFIFSSSEVQCEKCKAEGKKF